MTRFMMALLLGSALNGCAGLSSGISDGNYAYGAKDVSINHFGVNYSISIPLKVADQQVTAQTLASDCEAGHGTLKILTAQPVEDLSYAVQISGNSGPDKIFKDLCDKNPKLVRIVRGCS